MKLVARNNELTICRLLNRKTHTWLKFFSPLFISLTICL